MPVAPVAAASRPERPPGGLLLPIFWLPILALHACGAVAAWRLLPRGFPVQSVRFYAHEFVPVLVLGASLALCVLLFARRHRAAPVLFAYPALWGAAAMTIAVVFPLTGGPLVRLAALLALSLSIASIPALGLALAAKRWTLLSLATGALLGATSIRALRAPDPSTRPFARALPDTARKVETSGPEAEPSNLFAVDAREGRVDVNLPDLRVTLRPLLEFTSVSPDRFWTSLAPQLHPGMLAAPNASLAAAFLERRGTSLRAKALGPRSFEIESFTLVPEATYSHLNSFLELQVTRHARLALRFSPCPGSLIDVLYAGYPAGAPARFAYLDEHDVFRVMQASDAEKGPFTLLAEGKLRRGEPLRVTLVETGRGLARDRMRLTLHDWSAQLSTALSPTAGYGVAENAISFQLSTTHVSSAAHVFVTLAGTGVGRGWDSVGHAAGVYRNRVTVELDP